MGYSPWGRKESDTTERAHFTYILFQLVIAVKGESNGTPLQYSFAWKIPWTEEPGRLQSMGSLRVGHD